MIFSDKSLSRKLERTEGRSSADFVEARAAMFPESGAEWFETAGAFVMFDGVESPITQTFGLGVSGEVSDEDLDRIEAFFKERGAPVFHEVSPMADGSLFEMLKERGYLPLEFTSVMYRELNDGIDLGVSLNPNITTRIISAGEESLWGRTSASGWATEMPEYLDFMNEFGTISANCKGASPFVAELDGKPISAGMLFIHNNVAMLAGASTVPEGRRKGAQTALLDARLRFAVEQGCEIAMMCASPGSQSQRNAEKNNFRIAYTRVKWQLKI